MKVIFGKSIFMFRRLLFDWVTSFVRIISGASVWTVSYRFVMSCSLKSPVFVEDLSRSWES